VNQVDERVWRKRFIVMNLVQIGGTLIVLLALILWQTDVFAEGGHWIGFPIALAGLVISFFAPRAMARNWKRPPAP